MQKAGDIIRNMGKGTRSVAKTTEQVLAEATASFAAKRAASAQLEISKPAPTTKEISLPEKLLEAAVSIRERQPLTSELAFMAKNLIQVTLPHSDPGDVPLWTRTNGDLTLVIARTGVDDDGKPIGYPYGVIPRLLLYWITSEAVRNKNRTDINPRVLELGQNLSEFMRDVGLQPVQGGGKRSDARRLKDQMNRLFSSSIGFQYSRKSEGLIGQSSLGMLIAPRRELWWDPRNLAQGNLWQSWIELGQDFYDAIIASAVPVDVRALKGLRKSPLALDLYGWATHKTFSLYKQNQTQFIGYKDFMRQFGTDYNDPKNFKKKLHTALKKVQAVYPQLKIRSEDGGLTIYPSRTAVPRNVNPMKLS